MKERRNRGSGRYSEMWEWIIEKLERRESVAKLAKAEDLVISNASLVDIKRGIRKVYREVNANGYR